MARHLGPVLVDTNAIIECWRIGAWRALTGGYAVETVAECYLETQTGAQNRNADRRIDGTVLGASLRIVHPVEPKQLAEALTRDAHIAYLDEGEKALWAHAIGRTDGWVLCGPDKASLRIGIRLGLKERLVSLERLLGDVGLRPRVALLNHYTQRWHEQALVQISQLEGR